jgi:hypothetical protein
LAASAHAEEPTIIFTVCPDHGICRFFFVG